MAIQSNALELFRLEGGKGVWILGDSMELVKQNATCIHPTNFILRSLYITLIKIKDIMYL